MSKRFIKTVSFLLVFVLLFVVVQRCFVLSASVTKNVRGLYGEKEDTIDVLFLGASSMRTSFNAPVLYRDAGFTSYLLSYNHTTVATYKTMLKEALKTQQSVKLVFVDLRAVTTELKNVLIRQIVDNIKMSSNKLETARQYVPEDGVLSVLFPLIKNHNRWATPKHLFNGFSPMYLVPLKHKFYEEYSLKEIFIDKLNPLRGSVIKFRVSKNMLKETVYKMPTDTKPLFEDVQAALVDFMDYAKTLKDIKVVFMIPPYFYTDYTDEHSPGRPQLLNTAKKLVQDYGFDCIDFSTEEMIEDIGLVRNTDFNDSLHTNNYGQLKVTDYLIKHYIDQYDLPDHRTRSTQKDIEIDDDWQRAIELNQRLIDQKALLRQ